MVKVNSIKSADSTTQTSATNSDTMAQYNSTKKAVMPSAPTSIQMCAEIHKNINLHLHLYISDPVDYTYNSHPKLWNSLKNKVLERIYIFFEQTFALTFVSAAFSYLEFFN